MSVQGAQATPAWKAVRISQHSLSTSKNKQKLGYSKQRNFFFLNLIKADLGYGSTKTLNFLKKKKKTRMMRSIWQKTWTSKRSKTGNCDRTRFLSSIQFKKDYLILFAKLRYFAVRTHGKDREPQQLIGWRSASIANQLAPRLPG